MMESESGSSVIHHIFFIFFIFMFSKTSKKHSKEVVLMSKDDNFMV